MMRRQMLSLLAAIPFLRASPAPAAPPPSKEAVEAMRQNWKALLAKNAEIAKNAEPVTMSEAAWRQLLSPPAFNVLRQEGTERPGSSPLNNEKRAGVYVCAGCSLPLFTSQMKFDSGTGWPSFITTIPDAFATKIDTKTIFNYTEYHCAKCGGHHGHVFDDGPPPTGNRWCENGVAMRFIPQA
jgi:peptide-methionine (R)-S-oxide reductase